MATTRIGNAKQDARRRLVQPVVPALPLHLKAGKKSSPASPQDQSISSISSKIPNDNETSSTELSTNQNNSEVSTVEVLPDVTVDPSQSGIEIHPAKTAAPEHFVDTASTENTLTLLPAENESDVKIESEVTSVPNGLNRSTSNTSPSDNANETSHTIQQPKTDVLAWADEVAEQESGLHTPSQFSNNKVSVQSSSASQSFLDETPRFITANLTNEVEAPQSIDAIPYTNGTVGDHANDSTEGLQSRIDSTPIVAPHDEASPFALLTFAEYLLQTAFTKEYADLVIMIHWGKERPAIHYAHALVLARSSRIRKLIQRYNAPDFQGYLANIFPLRPILPQAFEAALRFLYSDTTLSMEGISPTTGSTPVRTELLHYIVSYWVSGIELGLPPVANRAAKLLEDSIDWDIVEAIMKDAMDIVAVVWQPDDGKPFVSDYADIGNKMIQTTLEFITTHIDVQSFKLDTNAISYLLRSRFSLLEDTRMKHNPALASMVFGSMPVSAPLSPSSPMSESFQTTPSFSDNIASKVLLNLDYNDLDFFCRRMSEVHGESASHVTRALIIGRESKRMKIISNHSVPNKQRMANSAMWDVAGFREFLTDGKLHRERVGFLLPNKH